MNFLQGVQRLRIEAGISGSGPTSVVGQVGELSELVEWYNSAYEDIQNLHRNWRFLWGEFSFDLIIDTVSYTAAAAGYSDLNEWKLDDVRVYLDSADEDQLIYEIWDDFKAVRQIGTVSTGRPTHFSISPNNSIAFWPTPDQTYTAVGEYYKSAETLSGNTDEPIFPSQYHMAIVWRALMFYAAGLSAAEKYTHGHTEYRRIMRAMEVTQLPQIVWGEPLA